MSTPVSVKNGAVALPSGFAIDFQDFQLVESQDVADTTPYGSNLYGRFTGSGTPVLAATVNGYAKKGGGVTDNPGFGKMSASGGDLGASSTFTVDTGITLVGIMIVQRLTLRHARPRGGVPVSFELVNGGDITTTWA